MSYFGKDILAPPAMAGLSWRILLAQQGQRKARMLLKKHGLLTNEAAEVLRSKWNFIARYEQWPPEGEWDIWAMICGRGFGKTRTGAETWLLGHRLLPEEFACTAIVGATGDDVRKFCLEGESGILSIAPKDFYPEHKRGDRMLLWPNGTTTYYYSSQSPDRLRGPNHTKAWCDEMASWVYLEDTWDNLQMTMRKSSHPQYIITTTPKPRKLLRDIIKDKATVVTGGSTYDNAENLSEVFMNRTKRLYEGTQTGRQELMGEMIDEAEGALWRRHWIDDTRLQDIEGIEIQRIVVAIDPPATSGEEAAEAGIIVAACGADGHVYVLDDRSARLSPGAWGKRAVQAYDDYDANKIVAEKNQGGEMVDNVIQGACADMHRDGLINFRAAPVKLVWAAKGKQARADPVSMLYEQNRVHHVGTFGPLEDQLCSWEPVSGAPSPDRLDALVWAITELAVDGLPGGEDFNINDAYVVETITAQENWDL